MNNVNEFILILYIVLLWLAVIILGLFGAPIFWLIMAGLIPGILIYIAMSKESY